MNRTQRAPLRVACHEQMTRMSFLLRCRPFPLAVTDGSLCYYRNRLIFLMSQFNRLQNLDVAAHPCQTICTHKTSSENKKTPLLSDGPGVRINHQRRGARTCRQHAGGISAETEKEGPPARFPGPDRIPARCRCVCTACSQCPSLPDAEENHLPSQTRPSGLPMSKEAPSPEPAGSSPPRRCLCGRGPGEGGTDGREAASERTHTERQPTEGSPRTHGRTSFGADLGSAWGPARGPVPSDRNRSDARAVGGNACKGWSGCPLGLLSS